jgi:hypothetical protein
MNKLEARTLFAIGLIFLSFLLLIPFLTFESTYSHEQAHVKVSNKYGIQADNSLTLRQYLINFYKFKLKPYSSGITYVQTKDLNELSLNQKREVLMAGIKSDLIFIYLISFILLISISLFFIFRRENLILYLFIINMTLILWLVTLTWSTYHNLNMGEGDLSLLLGYLFKYK